MIAFDVEGTELDGRPRPEVTPAAPSLVIRESAAPPPAGWPGTSP